MIEYTSPRDKVEDQVARSLHGEKQLPTGVTIKAATVGAYPEILEGLPVTENLPGTPPEKGYPIGTNIGKPTKESVLQLAIEDLNIDTRSWNCLRHAGIKTVANLVQYCPYRLLLIKNFGRRSLALVVHELSGYSLSLAEDPEKRRTK